MIKTGITNPITGDEILRVEEKDIKFWDKTWEELNLDEKAMFCSLIHAPFLATKGEYNNEENIKNKYKVYQLRNTFYY